MADVKTSSPAGSIFAVPAPIRTLFKSFPLRTYPAEPLPTSAVAATRPSRPAADSYSSAPADVSAASRTQSYDSPRLYLFANPSAPSASAPSPNPTCLKWQTYLRIAGVQHDCVPSTNHASPSGALPFLLPPAVGAQPNVPPLTGERIAAYARERSAESPASVEAEPKIAAYRALISQAIRPAWLHDLYLDNTNSATLTTLYLPASSLTHPTTLHSLRTAATEEVLKTTRSSIICPSDIHQDAIDALGALSALLGSDEWFFGGQGPSLFDAEVFAYTWVIMDPHVDIQSVLRQGLEQVENLVRHRQRLYERCWGT